MRYGVLLERYSPVYSVLPPLYNSIPACIFINWFLKPQQAEKDLPLIKKAKANKVAERHTLNDVVLGQKSINWKIGQMFWDKTSLKCIAKLKEHLFFEDQ